MNALAKEFQRLVQGGFQVETFVGAKVRGAQPRDGRPWRLDLPLRFFTGVQRSHLLSRFRTQPATPARTLGNAGCGIAPNYRGPDGRFYAVPLNRHYLFTENSNKFTLYSHKIL